MKARRNVGFSFLKYRTFRVRHNSIDTLYNVVTLKPSEVILLMAGAQPNKAEIWDTALMPRPIK